MTVPGPIFILGVPVVIAVGLQFLRRWTTVMAWLGVFTAGLVGVAIVLLPLTQPWQLGSLEIELGEPLLILGRELIVQPVDRFALAFLFFTTAGLFVVAWRLLPHSNFFPIGLVTVSLLAGALLVEQVVYTALLVVMAAILAVFPLHEPETMRGGAGAEGNGDGSRTSGGLRYMAYAVLALPGLMITQLLLDLFATFPNDQGLLSGAAVLMSLSFAILFGAVPFQSWLSNVAMSGSPPVVTFIFTVNLGTVWFMLLSYLQSYAWLERQAAFGPLFTALGLLMMVTGGLLAASQQSLGRLVGYATLVDNGAMLLALGLERAEGLALASMLLLARPLSLSLMTLGLQGLRDIGGGDDSREAVLGAAWRAPWRAVAFMVGGIALAGFPISLSFPARWGLYRLLAAENLFGALLALGGSAGVVLGLVGVIRSLLTPPATGARPRAGEAGVRAITVVEDRGVLLLIAVLILVSLILGLFPQQAGRLALQMAEYYTFFQ